MRIIILAFCSFLSVLKSVCSFNSQFLKYFLNFCTGLIKYSFERFIKVTTWEHILLPIIYFNKKYKMFFVIQIQILLSQIFNSLLLFLWIFRRVVWNETWEFRCRECIRLHICLLFHWKWLFHNHLHTNIRI